MDLQQPYAVLLALIDLEKAFNRVSHQLVIEDLAAMNVPGWLLLILISYIDDLSMLAAFNLTKCLIDDPVERAMPLTYNEQKTSLGCSSQSITE